MPHDLWTLVGWLICLIIVFFIVSAPIAACLALRNRRRAIASFKAWQKDCDERHQARTAGLRGGERFRLSQPVGDTPQQATREA